MKRAISIGAGLFLLPTTVAMLLFGAQTGRLEKRFGSKPPLLAGALFASGAFALLAAFRDESWQIYVAAFLLGAGIGLAFAAMANLIIENVGPAETGIATGMNTVTRTVGGAFGGAVVASILAGSLGRGGYPSATAYTGAFAACAIVPALAGIGGMPRGWFLAANVLGALLWAVGLVVLGYLSYAIPAVRDFALVAMGITIPAVLVYGAISWFRRRRQAVRS